LICSPKGRQIKNKIWLLEGSIFVSRKKYSVEERFEILKVWEDGNYSIKDITSMYNVNRSTIRIWKQNFHKFGVEGLKESTNLKRYSKQLKLAAIQDYQSGQYSLREITRKYEISDKSVLRQWIQKYNGHREIKASTKGMSHSMIKGRSTTWEERIDIVLYCLSNNKDFQRAADIYDVPYQQVYQWVRKYEDGGEEALRDKRGRKKSEQELSPEEKIKFKMKKLERENERLKAENEFLKKLEELERRRF
jgi:transposase-like protein